MRLLFLSFSFSFLQVGNGAIFGWLLFCIFASDLVGGLSYAVLLHFIYDQNWCQVHSALGTVLNRHSLKSLKGSVIERV